MDEVNVFDNLREEVRIFAESRDWLWLQFHTPKNLAMALVGEAGKLAAEFQWLTPEESFMNVADADARLAVQNEMADVLIYLLRLSDVLGVDLATAVREKLAVNESRFPILH